MAAAEQGGDEARLLAVMMHVMRWTGGGARVELASRRESSLAGAVGWWLGLRLRPPGR